MGRAAAGALALMLSDVCPVVTATLERWPLPQLADFYREQRPPAQELAFHADLPAKVQPAQPPPRALFPHPRLRFLCPSYSRARYQATRDSPMP